MELIREDNSEIKGVIKEIVIETINDSERSFDALLENNFKKFDETYKALA